MPSLFPFSNIFAKSKTRGRSRTRAVQPEYELQRQSLDVAYYPRPRQYVLNDGESGNTFLFPFERKIHPDINALLAQSHLQQNSHSDSEPDEVVAEGSRRRAIPEGGKGKRKKKSLKLRRSGWSRTPTPHETIFNDDEDIGPFQQLTPVRSKDKGKGRATFIEGTSAGATPRTSFEGWTTTTFGPGARGATMGDVTTLPDYEDFGARRHSRYSKELARRSGVTDSVSRRGSARSGQRPLKRLNSGKSAARTRPKSGDSQALKAVEHSTSSSSAEVKWSSSRTARATSLPPQMPTLGRSGHLSPTLVSFLPPSSSRPPPSRSAVTRPGTAESAFSVHYEPRLAILPKQKPVSTKRSRSLGDNDDRRCHRNQDALYHNWSTAMPAVERAERVAASHDDPRRGKAQKSRTKRPKSGGQSSSMATSGGPIAHSTPPHSRNASKTSKSQRSTSATPTPTITMTPPTTLQLPTLSVTAPTPGSSPRRSPTTPNADADLSSSDYAADKSNEDEQLRTSTPPKDKRRSKRKAEDSDEGTPPKMPPAEASAAPGKATQKVTTFSVADRGPPRVSISSESQSHAPSSFFQSNNPKRTRKKARIASPIEGSEQGAHSRPGSAPVGSWSSRSSSRAQHGQYPSTPTPTRQLSTSRMGSRSFDHSRSFESTRGGMGRSKKTSVTPSDGSHQSMPLSALVSPRPREGDLRDNVYYMRDPSREIRRSVEWTLRFGEQPPKWGAPSTGVEKNVAPDWDRGSPLQAWCFWIGFLFPPLWWWASWQRIVENQVSVVVSDAGRGVVSDDGDAKVDVKGDVSNGAGQDEKRDVKGTASNGREEKKLEKEQQGVDRGKSMDKREPLLVKDPESHKEVSFWLREAYTWRTRCRVMSLVFFVTYVPLIVLLAVFAR